MKKILIITIAILMVGAIATAAGLGFRAQGVKQAQVGSGRCEAFVDENGDGICDSYALRPQPQDGTGKRWAAGRINGGFKGNRVANRGTGLAGQENFVDENGDGICDLLGTRNGMGRGKAFGRK
ncbi:MAG: hypothetical protein KBI09_01755 [Mesotoga sp.]|jgi:hypothetical protein|nr:hypothetical protein [Mesotoga sp.]NLI05870.1 hypothetical protein [Thermotogaceae bacterium]HNS67386.1 hypothetical protein [Mesotoga infera]HOI34784.1 hypothetical protein [Mesotoga infera]HON27706.1 hypothetical protein [Mesotoga infera]